MRLNFLRETFDFRRTRSENRPEGIQVRMYDRMRINAMFRAFFPVTGAQNRGNEKQKLTWTKKKRVDCKGEGKLRE